MSEPVWNLERARKYLEGGRAFRSLLRVSARQLTTSTEWTSDNGSRLTALAGDWLLETYGSTWTVNADVFERTYEKQADGTYLKIVAVTARKLTTEVDIVTLEGIAHALPGDWLVCNPAGDVWPVNAEEFSRRYGE